MNKKRKSIQKKYITMVCMREREREIENLVLPLAFERERERQTERERERIGCVRERWAEIQNVRAWGFRLRLYLVTEIAEISNRPHISTKKKRASLGTRHSEWELNREEKSFPRKYTLLNGAGRRRKGSVGWLSKSDEEDLRSVFFLFL